MMAVDLPEMCDLGKLEASLSPDPPIHGERIGAVVSPAGCPATSRQPALGETPSVRPDERADVGEEPGHRFQLLVLV